ncbi:MAG: hypothetical protein ACLQQ4_13025 [Bacteroidia bacterium]
MQKNLVSYKKKNPKSFQIYLAWMKMIALYEVPEEKQKMLWDILDEGQADDWDFEKISGRDKRIRAVFGVSDDEPERNNFTDTYGFMLQLSAEDCIIMSN